jgi:DNA-binding Lrp family transcriptional regulator
MSESQAGGAALTPDEEAVLDAVRERFPVSWAPYCDIGESIGQSEVDVLNTVLKLRMTGTIPRIGATFAESFTPGEDADAALVSLLADIPTSEHPFEEIHEQLEFRGVDVTADWVRERIGEWIAEGTITSFGVQSV